MIYILWPREGLYITSRLVVGAAFNLLADPENDGNGHRISDTSVTWPIGCQLAVRERDERPVARESLKCLTFRDGQSSDLHSELDARGAIAGV